MPADPVSSGELIRRARRAQGLTQNELSSLSQLSVRTVRDIEKGIATARRPDSVRRLAVALQLTQAERQTLFAATGLAAAASVDAAAQMFPADRIGALMDVVRTRFRTVRVVASQRTATFDADGFMTTSLNERVISPTESGIDSTFLVMTREAGRMDDIYVRNALDCDIRRREQTPDGSTVVYEIGFPRRVPAGAHHAYRLEFGYRPKLGTGAAQPVAGEGFHQRAAVQVMRVVFNPARRPRTVEHVFTPSLTEALRSRGRVQVSGDGSAQIAQADVAPGWHGLRWRWPEI